MTAIVAAYNEQQVIAARIANLRALDYPAERLQVIVASDGSTDSTAAQARAAGADIVLELPRGGKIRAQDAAVAQATRRAARVLRRQRAVGAGRAEAAGGAFADPRVGYVCGDVTLPRRRRHQPGGPLLALRDVAAAHGVGAQLRHLRQRRDLRDPPRVVPERRPARRPRPLVPVQHGQARLARDLRRPTRARPRRWRRRSRASSRASAGWRDAPGRPCSAAACCRRAATARCTR